MDRREGARILRETVALLEALEQCHQSQSGSVMYIDLQVLDQLTSLRPRLEGVAE